MRFQRNTRGTQEQEEQDPDQEQGQQETEEEFSRAQLRTHDTQMNMGRDVLVNINFLPTAEMKTIDMMPDLVHPPEGPGDSK